ncbi:MAG: PASTA domain-containing protein, partial [Oscillospiraceae bacterium]
LYSVGIMMYEMLTGKLPFDSDSAVSIAIKQISDNAKRPRDIVPEIPEALEEITLKAMAKNPNVRYQSASQMLRDIDDFKKNPSIVFAYKYFSDDNSPTKYIDKSAAPQKKKKGEKGPKKKGSLSIALLLGVTAACVISTVALLLFAFGLLENEKIDVELPNFVGKTLVEIQSDAAYKTFKFTVVEDYNLADVGVVYDQSPLPPKQIKESGAITLFVSKGVEIVAVPDVVGMSSGDGKVALRNLGLVVRQESVSDENYETNKIVQVSPIAGSEIETGGEVTIYVNTLTMSSDTIVPKFIDMMLYDANTTLASYGLQIGVVTMQDNEKPAGTVIGQSIPEGSKVASNTSIDLVVSKGITSRAFSVTASGLPTKVEDGAAYQVYAVFGGATVAGPVAATPGGAFKVDFTATSDGKLDIYVKGKSDYLFQSFTINLVSGSVSAPTGGGSSYGNTVPATISVAPTAVSVAAGATTQLTATVTPSSAVAWSSSDPAIATVDANGLVTGVAAGSATITAAANGKTATCAVTVTPKP